MSTTPYRSLPEAVRNVFRRGSGTLSQVEFDSTGEVATLTEVTYDLPARRVAMRQRYLMTTEDIPEVSEWTETVVLGDTVHLHPPREGGWRVTEVPWPHSSPIKYLYWLLGYTEDDPTLTAGKIIDAQAPEDREGVELSLDAAEIDLYDQTTPVTCTTTVTDGTLRSVDLVLPGDDGSHLSLDLDPHGGPVTIDQPDTARESSES